MTVNPPASRGRFAGVGRIEGLAILVCLTACTSGNSGGPTPYCTQHGQTFTCVDGTSYPACAPTQSSPNLCDPDASSNCMGCIDESAGSFCSCVAGPLNIDDGGPSWECVGTGRSCK